jgi:hypothetical protein
MNWISSTGRADLQAQEREQPVAEGQLRMYEKVKYLKPNAIARHVLQLGVSETRRGRALLFLYISPPFFININPPRREILWFTGQDPVSNDWQSRTPTQQC